MSEDDKPVDPFYLAKGTELVDMLFDKNYIDNNTSRESIRELDEYFGFILASYVEQAVKVDRLTRKIKNER
jgi:hypothetical protein